MAWNGSDGSAPKPIKKAQAPSALRGFVAGLVVVALVCTGLFFVFSGGAGDAPATETEETSSKIKSETTASRKTPQAENRHSEKPAAQTLAPQRAPEEPQLPPSKRIVEMISVITNHDGSVLERFRTADGKTRSRQSAPPAVFDNASDQLIATALLGEASGAHMPPLPISDKIDADFAESLNKEIVINESDTQEIKDLKKLVMETRREILARMEKGGKTFSEVLLEHRREVNDNNAFRGEARVQLQALVDEGAAEDAAAYLEKVNDLFDKNGIERLEMPLSREERRAAIRAAAKARKNQTNK